MDQLYAWTQEDESFCYGIVVIAVSSVEAETIWRAKKNSESADYIWQLSIKESAQYWKRNELKDFVFEAGGNG